MGVLLLFLALSGPHEFPCEACHQTKIVWAHNSDVCVSCHDGFSVGAAPLDGPGNHPVRRGYPGPPAFNPLDYAVERGVPLFANYVECASCHNPHLPLREGLRVSMERSALCLTCHRK
jgi:predicted CXXCH cytochrome family protein